MLFILGLKGLTAPDKARSGMRLAAVGMLVAVIGTLLHHEIVTSPGSSSGLVLGSRHRGGDFDLDADDGHAAADRHFARLRRPGRHARRHRALSLSPASNAARSAVARRDGARWASK